MATAPVAEEELIADLRRDGFVVVDDPLSFDDPLADRDAREII